MPDAIGDHAATAEAGDAFGAELLDRSTKPLCVNALGARVLEQARDLLQKGRGAETSCVERHRTSRCVAQWLVHSLAVGPFTEPTRAPREKIPSDQIAVPTRYRAVRRDEAKAVCSSSYAYRFRPRSDLLHNYNPARRRERSSEARPSVYPATPVRTYRCAPARAGRRTFCALAMKRDRALRALSS
jgi:hypothetical protein